MVSKVKNCTLPSLTPHNIEECQEKLIASLDLSGLDKWPMEKAERARNLLREYHDVFSLKDNELGCTSQVKHSIKVTDD